MKRIEKVGPQNKQFEKVQCYMMIASTNSTEH